MLHVSHQLLLWNDIATTYHLTLFAFLDLFFYPGGAGAIKACVNVMGAQQICKCSLPESAAAYDTY